MTRVVVTTAHPVSTLLEKEIRLKINKKWADSTIEFDVDSNLVGGMKVKVGAKEVDSSIRRQLLDITKKLLSK